MLNNIENGKQMYLDHQCNYFYMEKADKLDDYLKLGITKEQEKEWQKEFIEYNKSELQLTKGMEMTRCFMKLSNISSETLDINLFKYLMQIIEENIGANDTFTTIRMCESIIHAIWSKYVREYEDELRKIGKKIEAILTESIKEKITIDQSYNDIPYMINFLTDTKIRRRICDNINDLHERLNRC